MQPILGRNGVIQFYKEDQFRSFVCADSVVISFSGDEKSVKTVGDGQWDRTRLQNLRYKITLSGLVMYDTDPNAHVFDLLDYFTNMVDIDFQIVYTQMNGTLYKVIRGTAGIRTVDISSPDDFVTGSITLTGQGEPLITDIFSVCDKSIVDYDIHLYDDGHLEVAILTLNEGGVPRYDYRVDGGSIETSLSTGWKIFNLGTGHTIEIWPVCDNGIRGTKLTATF